LGKTLWTSADMGEPVRVQSLWDGEEEARWVADEIEAHQRKGTSLNEMAVMVRAAGVPARVALGYVPGTASSNGTRLITTDDAHAWVEVYFSDLGWVPFDPTPLAASRAVTLPWAPRIDPQATSQQAAGATASAAPTRAGATKQLDPDNSFTPLRLPAATAAPWLRPVLIGVGVLVVLLALGALPALARIRQRRRRLADGSPGALWDELVASAQDLGVRLAPARTLRQTARELAGVMAGAASGRDGRGDQTSRASSRRPDPARLGIDGVRRLALAEEAASYAPAGRESTSAPLEPAVRAARQALLRAVPLRRRLRALLWPASLVTGARERWALRLGRGNGRLRRRLTPARRRTRTV
ncbi:MAG: transglutaminase domain-containing protein, partial [Kineosporiaceae bacterium]